LGRPPDRFGFAGQICAGRRTDLGRLAVRGLPVHRLTGVGGFGAATFLTKDFYLFLFKYNILGNFLGGVL